MKRLLVLLSAVALIAIVHTPRARAAAGGRYQLVESWVHFPAGVTHWGMATGVDVDSHDNVYVFNRIPAFPIMAFDKRGQFLRSWGAGMFTTTHFLRTDRAGNVWVTDRGAHEVFKFSNTGALMMTLGKNGVAGDNTSETTFNGVADVAVAKNGDVFIADGESTNTRVVKFSKDGTFIKWWGGKGAAPGQFDMPHSIALDDKGRVYVADRSNNRIQIFDADGKFLNQWTNFGTPWGVTVKDDRIYVVDGTAANCLFIANLRDGTLIEKIDGLSNPTAVAVDSTGAIYVGEVNGANVKKFVRR